MVHIASAILLATMLSSTPNSKIMVAFEVDDDSFVCTPFGPLEYYISVRNMSGVSIRFEYGSIWQGIAILSEDGGVHCAPKLTGSPAEMTVLVPNGGTIIRTGISIRAFGITQPGKYTIVSDPVRCKETAKPENEEARSPEQKNGLTDSPAANGEAEHRRPWPENRVDSPKESRMETEKNSDGRQQLNPLPDSKKQETVVTGKKTKTERKSVVKTHKTRSKKSRLPVPVILEAKFEPIVLQVEDCK